MIWRNYLDVTVTHWCKWLEGGLGQTALWLWGSEVNHSETLSAVVRYSLIRLNTYRLSNLVAPWWTLDMVAMAFLICGDQNWRRYCRWGLTKSMFSINGIVQHSCGLFIPENKKVKAGNETSPASQYSQFSELSSFSISISPPQVTCTINNQFTSYHSHRLVSLHLVIPTILLVYILSFPQAC